MNIKIWRQLKKRVFLSVILILPALFLTVNCSKERMPEKKQIILISIDTLRGDHLNSYGYFRETAPNLYRLTKDSVYYKEAYPNGCWTMPSHMSLLTGTLPSRHGVNKDWNSLDDGKYPGLNKAITCLPEVLKAKQIHTLKFAALPGSLGFNRGYDKDNHVDPFATNRKFSRLLQEIENHKEEDFFFFIHTWMVHAPYSNCFYLQEGRTDPETRYYIDNFRVLKRKEKYMTRVFHGFLAKHKLNKVKDCIDLYDGGIRYVDRYIGRLIETCRRLGIYDDMMLVVVSDHGEHFAEHYPRSFYDYHGRDYYEEFIKVPLIIKYPGKSRTGIKSHPVSLIDVMPTILDYYGLDTPAFVQGHSLLKPRSEKGGDYLVSEAVSESEFERKMIRLGHFKYIVTMQKPFKPGRVNWDDISARRLFDMENDPLEKNNLFKDLKFRQICIDFEKMLRKIIEHSLSTNLDTEDAEVGKETLDHLRAMGYLE